LEEKFKALSHILQGDLSTGELVRHLYATDASVYRELPIAVAFPKTEVDVVQLVNFARENKLSLIPRAAGTSLAGQCVGKGIVVDVSKYMTNILELNVEENWVRVQPGVIRDELNVFLEPHGLFFGPNTSTANRCMMGGMVGNNSCGSTSIVYGSTRDHVLELNTVLSDGSTTCFKGISLDEIPKDAGLEASIYQQIHDELSNPSVVEEIKKELPKETISRRNTGYAVDALLKMQPFKEDGKPLNFCELLCGSEGTLAFTAEIKLNVVPLPEPHDVVVAAHFESIDDSLKATVLSMEQNPTACELMDKTILDCTKENIEQKKNRFFVEGDPAAILMVEFRGQIEDEALEKAEQLIQILKESQLGYAFPVVLGNKTKSVWDLRKAGLGLLANIPGDKKAVACIEDTAVDVKELPEYIEEFSQMMKSFNQEAVYYAHAGAGELHLRPILDLKKSEDVQLFHDISEASAKLVKKYNGSLSGEHGDGRVRAEFIPLVVGEKNYELFKRIKKTWDPHNIFNPGKIVDAPAMNESLRYEPDVDQPEIETTFNFDGTGGILRTVEKCNGSGDCRKLNFSGGTMCPSYRATKSEKDSTRGRANILREFLSMNTKENPFDHPEIHMAMDLCLSCKGCKSECPSNIDMATLKSEFLYQYQETNGVSLKTKLLVSNAKLNSLTHPFAGIQNFISKTSLFKSSLGISKERSIPNLQGRTLKSWIKGHKQRPSNRKVYLFCDEITNFYDVEIGRKAVLLLNALGYEVLTVAHSESGRAHISKGFLDQAKSLAEQNVNIFSKLITQDVPLIGIEPSAILSFRDEYPNLVDRELRSRALKLSKSTFLIEEFLASKIEKNEINSSEFTKESKKIAFHGHCHQKALSSQDPTVKMLSLPYNYSVEVLNTGCCGMAGTFGYEKEHYDLSMQIGNMVLFPEVNKRRDETIVANGSSCRHQIVDGTIAKAFHPVEILYDALLT